MLRVKGFDHLNLKVADLDRALRFYVGLLGLDERRRFRRPDGSVSLVALRAGPQLVFLQPRPAGQPGTGETPEGMDHYSIEIEPVDPAQLASWLGSHDVPIDIGPVGRFGAQGDGISIYVRDPDGYRLELKQYPGDRA